MKRRGHLADRRVKLEEGDFVKIKKKAREGTYANTGVRIPSGVLGKVVKVFWDQQWFVNVSVLGTVFVFELRDLTFVKG